MLPEVEMFMQYFLGVSMGLFLVFLLFFSAFTLCKRFKVMREIDEVHLDYYRNGAEYFKKENELNRKG